MGRVVVAFVVGLVAFVAATVVLLVVVVIVIIRQRDRDKSGHGKDQSKRGALALTPWRGTDGCAASMPSVAWRRRAAEGPSFLGTFPGDAIELAWHRLAALSDMIFLGVLSSMGLSSLRRTVLGFHIRTRSCTRQTRCTVYPAGRPRVDICADEGEGAQWRRYGISDRVS
jgi:hypothetical protein